jgi:hypothetical protein
MDTDAEKLGGGECTARAAAGDGGAADAAAGLVKEVQHVRRRGMGEQQPVRRKRRDVRQRSSNLSPPNRAFGVACAAPFALLLSAYAPVTASGPPFTISDA